MMQETHDKTAKYTPGSVRELLVIALPMMASSVCDTVMTFTDRLFLSKLGSSQMNAALGGGMTSFMLMTFFIGLIGYSTALIGQYYGAGRKNNCAIVVTQAAVIALVAYPIILLIAPLAKASFRSFGIASEQLGPQIIYFSIMIYGTIIGLMRNVFSCFFSGIGRTRTVMVASVTAMVVNIFANYVLIFGHCGFQPMGIRGAAYGTIAGGLSGLLILMTAYFFGNKYKEYSIGKSYRFDLDVMRKLLKFGYPAGLEFFLTLSAFTAIIMLFQSLGQTVATAATITFNWDMVGYVPLIGIEIAVTSLVGRYMGAGRPDTAHHVAMSGIKAGILFSAVMMVLFLTIPYPLINIFRPDVNDTVFTNAMPLTVFMVRLMSLYVLLEAIIIAFCGALRGAGDTFFAMCMSVILHWLMVVILFVMFRVMHLSAQAGWVAMILWFMVLFIAFWMRYRSGRWREIKVINNEEPATLE
ncbi:MATE family efflux transporter [bacterium]|nr:MATE family efflux transporter [bacterium]